MCDPCETEDKIRGRFFCCEEAFRALCLWLLEEPRELIRRMGSDTTADAASSVAIHLLDMSSTTSMWSCPCPLGVMWPKEKGNSSVSPWLKVCDPSAVVVSHTEPFRSECTV